MDLRNIEQCPVGARCESCGTGPTGLAVTTADTHAGVLCLTMCPRCAGSGMLPRFGWPTAVRLVGQHCAHLGINVDRMAELRRGPR